MRRDAGKDFLLAFSVVTGIVTVWQMVEFGRARVAGAKGNQEILARLVRIEGKLK